MPSNGVLVAGNLVLDILVRPAPESVPWDTTRWVDSIEQHSGGNCANTAYAIAKFGVPSRALSLAGRDAAGDRILAALAQAGVDVSYIERCDLPTASTVGLVRSDGARALLHAPGASLSAFERPVAMTPDLTAGFAFLHVANPFGIPGLRNTAPEMLRSAREAGLRTSLDAGWDSRGEWMKVFAPCLPWTDALFVNLDEAMHLTGRNDATDAAHSLLDHGAGCVALKLGAKGCALFEGSQEYPIPGIPVPVVDTTGAGDCFAGGFLAAYSRGMSLFEAARFANAAAAKSVTALGSVSGLVSFEETQECLRSFSHYAVE